MDLRGPPNNVVIAGNHFQIPAMTAMIELSVSPHFEQVQRLLLDVPADIVYEQRRQKRRTQWDCAVTLKQVSDEIERMRESLIEQGFVIVTTESLVTTIERFLDRE